jgi:small-conductance mechanosensitive channel
LCFANTSVKTSQNQNIWLKTYQNYKNYNTIISNISKLEAKIKKTKTDSNEFSQLTNRLNIMRSKLSLYEKNKSFDNLLIKYKYEIPTITLREYIFKNSFHSLEKLLSKYLLEKNEFYLAKSTLENLYKEALKDDASLKTTTSLKSDIEYFTEYSENIEKTHQNLLEIKNEILKKYDEYENEVLIKHIFTFGILFFLYIIYKLLALVLKNSHTNYQKFLSLIFISTSVFFLLVRYIDDFIYIVTFLSVIAAALTIATREIILNIAGSIYIFFSNVVKVGDRVMVQFETKHTIGDIMSISMIKMKLQEVDDYTNLKEVKTVGRTIYIPNSYIFTKVFYNYSSKKDSLITDIIEFEFDINNDFTIVQDISKSILDNLGLEYKINFTLNSLKTGIIAILSYKVHYKEASQKRGELAILLLQEYSKHPSIKLKSAKKPAKSTEDEE